MLVYRIEHAISKYGPFSGGTYARWHVENNRCAQQMPSEARDKHAWLPTGKYYADYAAKISSPRFAFSSMEQLTYWFQPEARAIAHKDGFVLRIYDLSRSTYVPYRVQVVFHGPTAILLFELSLLDLDSVPQRSSRQSNIDDASAVSL